MTSMEDPFVSSAEERPVSHDAQRYSAFDNQLFSLNASSPAQAKRALEAHLAETERRLEEASKLGTALIEQQRELEEKLREVEQQQDEDQIGSDLRQKLADLEREYNEIGRETARAFLAPKRHAGVEEGHLGTPSVDQKSPLSPVLFASQATNSPSKVSVPSRKQRNQPSSRVHDIEFATEISTSLLAQVRQLQALLAEREDALKNVTLEKSRLELEAEGYAQRIRALDESEERYKDENWTLETRTHELMSAIKEAADRENRLNGSLGAVTSEKNAIERELEELKQTNAKLIEEQAAAQKANDAEIHLLRRNLNTGDTERLALQKKVAELNTQNEELAKVIAMRLRQHEAQATLEVPRDNHPSDDDQATPENSPPPSPNKFTPRHNHLETETLRSSLGHAHRMIQNLKSTIHREKTEKIELKRMLQEARDDIEQRRREAAAPAGPSTKRQKTKPDSFRKPARPDLLGAGRRGKTEIEIEDTDWEDNAVDATPSRHVVASLARNRSAEPSSDEPSDAYQTATEADDAFETANERETATESEAFQTGIESMADDSSDTDELTETEDSVLRTPRQRVSSSLVMAKARDRSSYQSTASTSADEDEDIDGGFPSPSQTQAPRYRLRKKRSVLRTIRPSGEAPMAYSSRPSSARDSPATSFTQDSTAPEGQSLFAELAELEGGEDEDGAFDTNSQVSTPRMLPTPDSRRPSEVILEVPPKPAMVDSGVMTDPWEPSRSAGVVAADDTVPVAPSTPTREIALDAENHVNVKAPPMLVNSATQWTPLKSNGESNGDQISSVPTPPKMAWDDASDAEPELVNHTAPSPAQLDLSSISSQETSPVAARFPELSTSYFVGGSTEPVALPASKPWEMTLSNISFQATAPMTVQLPEPEPVYVPQMDVSTVFSEHTLPVAATIPEPVPVPVISVADHATSTDLPELDISTILSESTQPIAVTLPEPESIIITPVADQSTSTEVPELDISVIWSEHTEPIAVSLPERVPEPEPVSVVEEVKQPELPGLSISGVHSVCTEPVAPRPRELPAPALPDLAYSAIRSVETLPAEHMLSVPIMAPLQLTDEKVPPTEPQERAVAIQPEDFVSSKDGPGEDSRPATRDQETSVVMPLGAITGNAVTRDRRHRFNQADSGAQTILSSKQIDQILMDRVSSRPLSPPDSDKAKDAGPSPFATPKARPRSTQHGSNSSLQSAPRRPSSSASLSSSINSHPPLPADHREAILAAEKKSLEQRPVSPGLMAPPLAPASAYRASSIQRPRTPNEVGVVHSTKTSTSRSKIGRESQVSRASSVSSFASEIEERFNTTAYANPMPNGYAAGTDPRMIQAITQTMIGEFLWKYTRRTVTGEISNTRHRRYFWVHPYTRTLYWSDQDPQSAGKNEVRTKSVPIEAVRVVADDNPYPPGLHCRSLEVVSPGRRVRFTASTSQRHETWFNALSYLLLRNADENGDGQEPNAALEDIDESNPGFRSASRQTARMSFSSSRSRTVRNAPKQRAGSAMSVRQAVTPGRVSPAPSARSHISSLQVPDDGRHGSTSRLSTILNTTIKGSFGRRGRPSYSASSVNEGSVHDGSLHDRDSEEDFRRMMEREQESDRLENVRACCDGKHDVSSLARTSRYSPRVNRNHSHH
ncbi:putative nuclear migration protein (ApsA) [Aspergillus clavatus NRRL 1]|uniref:Nuclear migration protein (ApsA), putative n=1 Tax=Aspergillus clavatus (strain ATCC 1007 / CBS 513.65 / DSM 816 / NCTC 3887 / NRRL 1 / QM 1276 / 107) TaxID=344612 RepID=A1CAT4_ASPCL|nr:nuclear migration protein (ApsA), putative [Aspergillus clavatus NRRL 1]EAW12852.1 nuclear migration protein (ApsA), putative [Aspergillus clavatus NRRL 1]